MQPHEPASPAERRVLRWFLAAFFLAAALVVAATWWRKSSTCASACVTSGHAAGRIELAGGGRLGTSVRCVCVERVERR
jgi:ferric-dicitrate binding protein FerR (iron transport regulator)